MEAIKVVETYREKSGDVVQVTTHYGCENIHCVRDSLQYCKSRKRKNNEVYYYSIRKMKKAGLFKILIIKNQTKI